MLKILNRFPVLSIDTRIIQRYIQELSQTGVSVKVWTDPVTNELVVAADNPPPVEWNGL